MTTGGVLEGGWGYVIAVYVISATVYAGYTFSVIRRDAAARARLKDNH